MQAKAPKCFLMKVGLFIHAYEGAAFAIHRLTGYKIRLVHRRTGDIRMLGFNASQQELVRGRLLEAGIKLRDEADGLWSFEGGDTTADESLITVTKTTKERSNETTAAQTSEKTLLAEVMGFNLSASTPMEAMIFLSDLQRRYGKE